MSFLPYAMAGNKTELHENKEEFALQKCFITRMSPYASFSGDEVMQMLQKARGLQYSKKTVGYS